MAKLRACYALCPLIDRCPIGVTPDSMPGCVIVTLGKNIVIRYKLADQKQSSSWSSKDKISAPVIYDHIGQQYVAVFNQSIVRLWNSVDVHLNKVKKNKFDQPIHLVLNHISPSEPIVIFKNGSASSLSNALANRKSKWRDYVANGTLLKDCFLMKLGSVECVGMTYTGNRSEYKFLVVEVGSSKDPLVNLSLSRKGQKLLGLTTVQAESSVMLLTFWSDGQLWSMPINKATNVSDGVGQQFYSLTGISSKHEVAMVQISDCHIAVYGADPSEEGAMLLIVNTQFRLVQARQHYKLFSDKANLWVVGTSILLVVGHSLAVAPFTLDTERLSSLIGSHRPLLQPESKGGDVEQILEMMSVVWEDQDKIKQQKHKSLYSNGLGERNTYSEDVSVTVKKLAAQGYSQSIVCETIVPSLIKDGNIMGLLWVLQNFPDFPESALVHVLTFCLDAPRDIFTTFHADSHLMENSGEDSQDSKHLLVDLAAGQRMLLNMIFTTPLSEAVFLPLLRSRLTLPHCLALLQYIAQSLPQTTDLLFSEALLRWGAILLDSHYQQLLLSRDQCISSTVMALKELVESQVEYMDDMKALYPMVERLKCGQPCHNRSSNSSYHYSIETLTLY